MKISYIRDGEVVTEKVIQTVTKINGLKIYQTKDDDVPEYSILEKLPEPGPGESTP